MDEDGVARRIIQINPLNVGCYGSATGRDIQHQVKRLESEGQIQPLVAIRADQESQYFWIISDDWPYAYAQHSAMRELLWDSMLIAVPEADAVAWLESQQHLQFLDPWLNEINLEDL